MSSGTDDTGGAATYAEAGVDIDAGDRAVALMAEQVRSATRPEVLGDLGGFAGLFRLDTSRYKSPVLATSTDGVGTKLAVAQALDRHDTIGQDLVGMVVDDLVVCGAEPLFMTDYIACGQVVPERISAIVGGIAAGCRIAGCALVGGETAEHPGIMQPQEYDLAGAGTGIVDEDAILGPERVRPGDVVVALGSSGMHSNGYALARHALLRMGRMTLDAEPDELDRSLGDELLVPTRIYAQDCLTLAAETEVHAFAHVTGGGLAANLARMLPATLDAVVDRSTWTPQAIFALIEARGRIDREEMERTFNLGVGMLAVLAQGDVDRALAVLVGRKVPAWVAGEVVAGAGEVRLTGAHPS
ncbi:MAG: phosphoribosylformylglycinamidine cyclo-ligase [Streptosporangiales bacterium]|nr:phosphoribosylformylglycinamidine cyclo-ligase [Streptosporangiales bacterium]